MATREEIEAAVIAYLNTRGPVEPAIRAALDAAAAVRARTEVSVPRDDLVVALAVADGLDHWHKYGEGYTSLLEFIRKLSASGGNRD